MIDGGATLARRLERYRATRSLATRDGPAASMVVGHELAERLAAALDGEIVRTPEGAIVRCEGPSRPIPLDRERLATLPGQPPPGTPLVCLDTETTGLATAAGTVAFLIGLGWWEADSFRQVQLLLPDHADEPALLTALAATIPPHAWLVTYNGRGFDWPLLVARYRLARRAAPAHDGHLDLLPIVRRLFRHRMANARLRTAEADLLGFDRVGDVEGWQIPVRYFDFLRGGSAWGLVEVVRHNDQDVRSLARLLALLEVGLGDAGRRAGAPPGDLAGLARAFAREHRLSDALECLNAATTRAFDAPLTDPPWTAERIAIDRAHLLRRLGRHADAAEAWAMLAAGTGSAAIEAAIELAKLHEHRLGDLVAALDVTRRTLARVERRRQLGWPTPFVEANLLRRADRLRRRLAVIDRRAVTSRATGQPAALTNGTRGSIGSVAQRSLT